MPANWNYALLSVFVVSTISLIGIAAISFSDRVVKRTIFISVSLAAGAMFGDAFIHILPESFAEQGQSDWHAVWVKPVWIWRSWVWRCHSNCAEL